MKVTMTAIKTLREKTGAGVMDAKKALEESGGDIKKAEVWIGTRGLARAEKKTGRETKAGVVYAYIHHNNLSGSLVELNCETDFVAKTDDFRNLAKELAMQVNSMNPQTVEEFLRQEYVREPQLTIEQLIKQVSGKVGENIRLARFQRFVVGEEK